MIKKLVSGLLISLCLSSPVEGRGLGGLRAIRNRNVIFDENYEPDEPLHVRCLDYVHQKLNYEKESVLNDIWYPPKTAFLMGRGDCDEHAFCLDYLLEKEGVESRIVVGSMNGDIRQAHIWNELEYNGRTLILDSCVGGIIDKKQYYADPRNTDYRKYSKEYYMAWGFDRLITNFKKRIKNGNNKPMIVKFGRI
ncbi:hypothetical protein GOV12_05300 [Candidatus Pacearchaeota archaeon]|nr:hypothetical protein [Candidatus Pacearchaeota archaeon]